MRSLLRIFSFLKNYKPSLVASILCNILTAIFTVFSIPLIIPFFQILFEKDAQIVTKPESWYKIDQLLQYQFSHIVNQLDKEQALLMVCGLIILVFFLKNLFRYLGLFFMAPVRMGIIRDIRQQLYQKYLSLPLAYYSEERKGDLISRISTDVIEVEWSVLNVLEMIFKSPLIILGSIAIMLYIHPGLTLFVFVLLILTIVVIGGISQSLKRQSAEAQKQQGFMLSLVDESLSGLRIIKGFNASQRMSQQYQSHNDRLKQMMTRILWRRDLSSPLSEFLGIVVVAVLLWYGSKLVFSQSLEPEVFFAFIFAFYQVIEPSKALSKAYYNIQKGTAAAERIDQVVLDQSAIFKSPEAIELSGLKHGISFEKVSFSYPNTEVQVLSEVSFDIPSGKNIALVGESGAGKTTIADLIPRFYEATGGTISLDGKNIRDYSVESLRSLIGIVSQEPILFHDTIANNISFGRDISEQQIIRASQMANAHDFIMATPKGYETNIGDQGLKLSGGQRQRITLARALVGNPPILILDEATSSLDSDSERAIQQALKKVLVGRTAIIIAHRLSTIQDVDHIIVIEKGKIIQQGKHTDLMEKSGAYKNFVQLQAFR
jgi:subfamily B ATP-binding cassette protein MsbA